MSVRTDVINLNVNVNGNKAQNELNNLRKKAADIKLEMEGLNKRTAEYKAKKAELAEVEKQMVSLKQTIGLASLSQKELVAELNKLKAMKGSVVPFSNEFKELDKQIKAVENRLYDVRNGVQGFSSFFSKIKDEVKQFGVLAAGYLGFQFITSQFTNIINGAAKMSDSLADLQRSSGLTAAEVKALNEEFKTFDTRTSTETLRNIATIAARLGLSKDEIAGFTREFDKLVVVLGGSLGDADAAATTLGKILNVFDGKITADNISRLGNAIVSLDQSGVASGAFLADFAQRLSGVSKNANISLGSLLGLGAALEETGARSESGSTAIQKVISTIASDIPKAAKIAGVNVKEFADLFAKAPEEAIIKFSEGLVKNKASFAEVTASFKDAGEEGARVVTTISAIGNAGDLMRQRIKEGQSAIQETTTLNEGFALKNETFAATLDKLGKEFNRLVQSPAVTNFLQGAVEGAAAFIKVLRNLPEFIAENRTAFIALTGIVLAYIAAKTKATGANLLFRLQYGLLVAQQAIHNGLLIISTTLTRAYALAKGVLTGQITLATAKQALFNAVARANPLVLLISLVTAAATAWSFFADKTKKATAEQRAQQAVTAETLELTKKEESTARSLFNQITKTNLGYDEKKKLLNQLIAQSPGYLKGLTLENIKTAEGEKILEGYIGKLREANRQRAIASVIQKKEDRVQELEAEVQTAYVDVKDSQGNVVGQEVRNKDNSIIGAVSSLFSDNEVAKANKAVEELKQIKGELDVLYKQVESTIKPPDAKTGATTTTVGSAATTSTKEKKSGGRSDFDQQRKEADKFYQDLLKLRDKASLKELPKDEAELEAVRQKYAELTARAKDFFVKKLIDSERYGQEEKIITEAREKEINAIIAKYVQQRTEERNEKEYAESLDNLAKFYEQQKALAAQALADGKLNPQQYDATLKDLDRKEAADRLQVAQDYSQSVKKAAEDVKAFRKQQEQQTTADLVEETKKRLQQTDQDKLAAADRKVLASKGKGIDAETEAKKNRLQVQFDLEMQSADLTAEMRMLKEEELQAALAELDQQALQAKYERIMEYVGFFSEALDSLNTIANNNVNREITKEKKKADNEKKTLKKQLDAKLISQAQYDQQTAKIEEGAEKRERELKRKQAIREKALNLFKAIINTARAVAEALPNIPLSIAAGIAGGLQIAAVANADLPELGSGDWVRTGDKHKDKSGGIPVKIERDEAVMSAAAMTDSDVVTVTGTTAQITSALNARKGGTAWAAGAMMAKWRMEDNAQLNPNLVRYMATGGLGTGKTADDRQAGLEATNALLRQLINKQDENTEEIRTMKTRLKAEVVLKEFREKEELYNAAKNASGIAQ